MPTWEVVVRSFDAVRADLDEMLATIGMTVVGAIVTVWTTIGKEIVLGVIAGFILLCWEAHKRKIERLYQISYFFRLAALWKDNVLQPKAKPLHGCGDTERVVIEAAVMRRVHFQLLKESLQSALAGRSSHLSYEQKREIADPLEVADLAFHIPELELEVEAGAEEREVAACKELYDSLEQIDWLQEYVQKPSLFGRVGSFVRQRLFGSIKLK